jgi:nitroreductase
MATLELVVDDPLNAILCRRAVKVFEPIDIPVEVRAQILLAARQAPSSFNLQPYRLYWVGSAAKRAEVARLCHGQKPAATASALVVAVADIGSMESTTQGHAEWMRTNHIDETKIRDYEQTAKIGRILFMPGPLHVFAAFKWAVFRLLNLFKVIGMPPLTRREIFKWATKGTSLACQNLMIATEALGLNTCPMEGFDGRRLSKYLGLSSRFHEIVMVIAIGKKPDSYIEKPQWRRPLDATVTIL